MSIANLTDEELEYFLREPNRFLANPDNARRALGLTPATVAVIQESLLRKGMAKRDIDARLAAVVKITELISSIIKKIDKEGFARVDRFVRTSQQS